MAVTRRRRRDADEEPAEEKTSRRASSASRFRDDDDDDADEIPRASRRRERESTRDEDDDRPSRSRSRDEDDDDDEPRSRRRSRDDDDDDDQERLRSRRRPRDDDEEQDDEDRPRSRRGSRDRDDEDADRPRRGRSRARDDDDEDDEPRGRRRRASSKDDDEDDDEQPEARSGFAGFRKARQASGKFGDRFKVPEEAVLIKIMDDETVHNYNVHWINRRPWVCIEKDCPLCDAGHTPDSVGLINVVQVNGKKPVVQQWEAGPQAVTALEKKAKARSGPLTRQYYSVERYQEGGNGPWKLNLDVVRESEVIDDWQLEPLTDDDLDRLEKQCKGEEYVKYPTRKELREVAKTLDD